MHLSLRKKKKKRLRKLQNWKVRNDKKDEIVSGRYYSSCKVGGSQASIYLH